MRSNAMNTVFCVPPFICDSNESIGHRHCTTTSLFKRKIRCRISSNLLFVGISYSTYYSIREPHESHAVFVQISFGRDKNQQKPPIEMAKKRNKKKKEIESQSTSFLCEGDRERQREGERVSLKWVVYAARCRMVCEERK